MFLVQFIEAGAVINDTIHTNSHSMFLVELVEANAVITTDFVQIPVTCF